VKRKILIFFFVSILTLLFSLTGPFKFLELKLFDSRLEVRGKEKPPKNIVIVAIDDDTYNNLKVTFPYPRTYYAKLLNNLKKAGAKEVVFDIEFDTPSTDDSIFSNAIRNFGNVILASKLTRGNSAEPESILRNVSKTGFANLKVDKDGVVRKYLFSYNGNPSIALSAYKILNKMETFKDVNYLYFYGPRGVLPYYSFWSVLDDKTFLVKGIEDSANDANVFYEYLKDSTFYNKIVFVGVTLEELQDFKPVPFTSNGPMPGAEIHATALGNLFENKFINILNFKYIIIIILILTVVLLNFPFSKSIINGILFFVILAVIFIVDYYIFVKYSLWVKLIPLILATILSYIGGTTDRLIREQKERKALKSIFHKYVPGIIMEELLKNPKSIELGGEERNMTVLFSDIEGFTTFSEGKDPKHIVGLINRYFSELTKIIFEYQGTVDKYEGDAIMAIFGAPYYYEDHPLKAVVSTLKMKERVHQLWNEDFPRLKTRFGVNTGQMIVGNMGSEERIDYTVIGDSVNLASRLEGANKQYGTEILIGEETANSVKEKIPLREIDRVRVLGTRKAIRIFEPLDLEWDDELREIVSLFHRAIEYYRNRDWERAANFFKEILKLKEDNPSKIFLKRLELYKVSPPPEDWDGTYNLTEK